MVASVNVCVETKNEKDRKARTDKWTDRELDRFTYRGASLS